MTTYGYARVSTAGQNIEPQREALRKAGCELIREEKASATSRAGRPELKLLLEFIRPGDTLVVTRIDRLARSMKDLQDIIHELRQKGANIKATEQPIDTSNAAGKAFLDMLGVFAEFETNLRRERQLEGIEKAKANGKYKGRKPVARNKTPEILRLAHEGLTRQAIADELEIGIASVYRALKEARS